MKKDLSMHVMTAPSRLYDWFRQNPLDIIYISLTAYVIYNYFWPFPPHQALALFLLLVMVGLFMKPRPAGSMIYLRVIDYFLSVVTIIAFGYVVLYHYEIATRQPMPSTMDVIMGVAGTAIVLEGTRRGFGWAMFGVVSFFLAYFFLGRYLPASYGGHAGYFFDEIINALYLSTVLDGIFGSSTYVFFHYIFLFFLFGNILSMTGATTFLMNLVRAIVGTTTGGAAMVAVGGSSAVGSVTGSSMANVMITGVVTIPMMKKTGFLPWVAAGIEAVASSGGQIMPPVMGAVSFLMMNFLGMPYIDIITAALVPALLFFVGVLASVFFYSLREKLGGIDASEVPRLKDVLKQREGITFAGGFIVLLTLMILKYSPMLAVMSAIVTSFFLSFLSPTRMTPKKILALLHDTSAGFVGLGAVGAGIGIVICATLQSGLAFRTTTLIMQLSGGALIPTLFAVFFACFFLGMGLPPIVIYIVSVLVAAPSLIQLGVTPLAAHLFCFYAAICCEINPPIATAAMAASLVANTDFWKTCWYSMLFGVAAHLLAFSFAIDSSMLMIGSSPGKILFSITTAFFGVVMISWGIAGRFRGLLDILSRAIFAISGTLLVLPGMRNMIIAVIAAMAGGLLCVAEIRARKSARLIGNPSANP